METFFQAAQIAFNGDSSPILQLASTFIVGGLLAMIIGAFGNKNGALMMVLLTALCSITIVAKTCYGAVSAALRAGGLK